MRAFVTGMIGTYPVGGVLGKITSAQALKAEAVLPIAEKI